MPNPLYGTPDLLQISNGVGGVIGTSSIWPADISMAAPARIG